MNRLPSLADIAAQTLAKLSRQTVLFAIGILLIGGLAITILVLRPANRKFEQLQQDTTAALASRNQELVKAAVEQAAGNIVRIPGAAENAVMSLRSTLTQNPHPSDGHIPLESEFFDNGRYAPE